VKWWRVLRNLAARPGLFFGGGDMAWRGGRLVGVASAVVLAQVVTVVWPVYGAPGDTKKGGEVCNIGTTLDESAGALKRILEWGGGPTVTFSGRVATKGVNGAVPLAVKRTRPRKRPVANPSSLTALGDNIDILVKHLNLKLSTKVLRWDSSPACSQLGAQVMALDLDKLLAEARIGDGLRSADALVEGDPGLGSVFDLVRAAGVSTSLGASFDRLADASADLVKGLGGIASALYAGNSADDDPLGIMATPLLKVVADFAALLKKVKFDEISSCGGFNRFVVVLGGKQKVPAPCSVEYEVKIRLPKDRGTVDSIFRVRVMGVREGVPVARPVAKPTPREKPTPAPVPTPGEY
jgi:hypothetical protein